SPGTLARRYTYGLDSISQTRWNGSAWVTHFYGTDGLGSVRCLIDTTGAITDTYTYDAYGNLIASTGSGTPNDLRYTGELLDPDIGLVYLRARWMNPNLGRLWTMDENEGEQSDPISLHRYLYVSDNAADLVDPSGHIAGVFDLSGTLF